MNSVRGRPSGLLRSPYNTDHNQLACLHIKDDIGNQPDISNDPRAFGQDVSVIHIIFHQAMGQICLIVINSLIVARCSSRTTY